MEVNTLDTLQLIGDWKLIQFYFKLAGGPFFKSDSKRCASFLALLLDLGTKIGIYRIVAFLERIIHYFCIESCCIFFYILVEPVKLYTPLFHTINIFFT